MEGEKLHKNVTPRSKKREIKRIKCRTNKIIDEDTAYSVLQSNLNLKRMVAFRQLVEQKGFAEALYISLADRQEKEIIMTDLLNENMNLRYQCELVRLVQENNKLRVELEKLRVPSLNTFDSFDKPNTFTCSSIGCNNKRIRSSKPGSVFYHCRKHQPTEFKNQYFCSTYGCHGWKQKKPVPYNMCSSCILKRVKTGFFSITIE
jgi:hypothetical protein